MDQASSSPSEPQKTKFTKEFTPLIDDYLKTCQEKKTPPTIKDFAATIGTDEKSIWAWATKNKKAPDGNTTTEMARPNFFAAVKRLEKAQQEQEEKDIKLTPQQEFFCQLYASDREFFGNGVQSYIEAYDINIEEKGQYNVAKSGASENLSKPYILDRINELLELGKLNDAFVDKQLQFIIAQNADLSSKTAAIREYNKLKQRITDKVDHTTKGKALPTPIYGGKSE